MKTQKAIEQGKADGLDAVQDFLSGGGSPDQPPSRDDLRSVAYGQSSGGWDTAAINAGAAQIAGIPEEHRAAYYEAYQAEALRAAREAYDQVRAGPSDEPAAPTVETVRRCPPGATIRGSNGSYTACWQGSDGPMRARIYWHTDGQGWALAETVRDTPLCTACSTAIIEAHSVSLDNVEVTVWRDEQGEYYITPRNMPGHPMRSGNAGGGGGSGLIRRYLSSHAAFKACQTLTLKDR